MGRETRPFILMSSPSLKKTPNPVTKSLGKRNHRIPVDLVGSLLVSAREGEPGALSSLSIV